MNTEKYHAKSIQVLGKSILLFESLISQDFQCSQKETGRDIVSSIDLAIHNLISDELSDTNVPIISEEGSLREWGKRPLWVIDPVDGTTNMISGIPFYGISIGLMQKGEFSVGSFAMPATKEIFYTTGITSAYCNQNRMRVTEQELHRSLIGVCFSSKGHLGPASRTDEFKVFQELNESSRGCLRLGSAGCSICYVACGKLGAAFGISVKTWDVAGSVAIAKAAGCEVRIADGETPESLHFIAGKGKIVDQIQARLKKTVPNLDWRGI
jgi:myo-inositol-1(or 4)-monophosphatase